MSKTRKRLLDICLVARFSFEAKLAQQVWPFVLWGSEQTKERSDYDTNHQAHTFLSQREPQSHPVNLSVSTQGGLKTTAESRILAKPHMVQCLLLSATFNEPHSLCCVNLLLANISPSVATLTSTNTDKNDFWPCGTNLGSVTSFILYI